LAELCGLAPATTIAALPIEDYVGRIVEEDRASVAKAISEAVVTGEPYHEEYRVTDGAGEVRNLMAFGRCFRDTDGVPSLYAGIAFPVEDNPPGGKDPVLTHVAVAHLHAVEEGRTVIAGALEAILEDLAGQV
jgi:hypothetical protein